MRPEDDGIYVVPDCPIRFELLTCEEYKGRHDPSECFICLSLPAGLEQIPLNSDTQE